MEHQSPDHNNEKSEFSNEQQTFLDNLNSLFMDPVATEAIEKAQEYNKKLNELGATGASEEVISAHERMCMNEVDSMWPYMNQSVEVSGRIYGYNGQSQTYTAIYLDKELPAKARGFTFLYDLEKLNNTDQDGLPDKKAYLQFNVESEKGRGIFVAEPEEVFIKSDNMSFKYAEKILQVQYPEHIKDINEAYELAGEKDSDKIYALSDMTVESTEDDVRRQCKALEVYIDSTLNLEKHLPYNMIIEGLAYQSNADGLLDAVRYLQPRHELVTVSGVTYVCDSREVDKTSETTSSAYFKPVLHVQKYDGARNEAPEVWLYPFESIRSLDSLRCLARGYNTDSDVR